MSRFYQKYLNGLSNKSADATSEKIDPTSMSLSTTGGADKSAAGKGECLCYTGLPWDCILTMMFV